MDLIRVLNGMKKFKPQTMGVKASGNVTFKDVWVLGGGIGYSLSTFNYGPQFKEVKIDSFCFGPQATCLFEKEDLQLTLLGIYNMYDLTLGSSKIKNVKRTYGMGNSCKRKWRI